MVPALNLAYSSQAAIYGSFTGMGWSLSIPEIREDTSRGRMRTHSHPDDPLDDPFVSSMAGGRPLVMVNETSSLAPGVYKQYRAKNDTSFARYERMLPGQPFRWRVLTTDGTIHYFGEPSRMAGCTHIDNDGFAPLTNSVDGFGNSITYEWEGSPWTSIGGDECRIKKIRYGANAAAGLTDVAEVEFSWAGAQICNGIYVGSQIDYRSGVRIVTGASQLQKITARALDSVSLVVYHTREITLGYSPRDSCDQQHASVTYLTSIQESAWREGEPAVDLPAVTFDYGAPLVALTDLQPSGGTPWLPMNGSGSSRPNTLAWGYRYNDDRWPSVEAMLVDLNGDGTLDRMINASTETTDGQCRVAWRPNLGVPPTGGLPVFGPEQTFTLPRLKWHGNNGLQVSPPEGSPTAYTGGTVLEKCSLNHQVTRFQNSDSNPPGCHTGNGTTVGCVPATDPTDNNSYCAPNGTECPAGSGEVAAIRTYLVYRWMDADGDGLTDLIAAVHGNIKRYDIEQGNLPPWPRDPEPTLFGPWPSCDVEMERCKNVDPTCLTDAFVCGEFGLCSIDWPAVNACVTQAPTKPCDDMVAYLKPPPPSGPPPPGGPNPPNPESRRSPYQRCEGLYPWFIYRNQGNGQFPLDPVIKYQPVPLESDNGNSSVAGPNVVSSDHAIMDFDGDGVPDAIVRSYETQGPEWQVYLGDGTGGFSPKRYTFFTRSALPPPVYLQPGNKITAADYISTATQIASSEGLLDVNGDGLPDHWRAWTETTQGPGNGNANIAFHAGLWHQTLGISPPGTDGEVNTPFLAGVYAVKPGDDTIAADLLWNNNFLIAGLTTAKVRSIDVDNDGRVDIVEENGGAAPKVFFNVGGQFRAPSVAYPGDWAGFERNTVAPASTDMPWELQSDLVDLDADGIAESASFPGGAALVRYTHPTAGVVPRLLRSVDNGRGAETTIDYAAMHDDTVVLQCATPSAECPDTTWTDAWGQERPNASPKTMWVVKSMTTVDDFAGTTEGATTSYFYKHPRHGRDEEGHYAFRGFETVTTTAESGMRTVQTYSYVPDWSGRLVETVVHPAFPSEGAETDVRSISKTTWVERSLFGGAVKTYHASLAQSYTCANNQSQSECEESPAAYQQTVTNHALKLDAYGQGVLWVDEDVRLMAGTAEADGDRQTVTEYELMHDEWKYRLQPTTTVRAHRDGGMWLMFAKSATTWMDLLVPLTEETWVNLEDADRAITRFEYDLTTGNLVKRWKPEQNAAGTTFTSYTYDSRKLFVQTETNELGHVREYLWEYGTGTKLQTDGPNQRACTTGVGNCPPPDATYPLMEQERIVVDGLGRMLERWDTFSTDGSLFKSYQVETASYVDAIVGGIPTSVTSKQLRKLNTSLWTEKRTDLDGHGRPIQDTVFVQGSAPADQVTSFTYRDDGTLAEVKVPDPTQNNASQVTYRYGFDSLGRATSIRRPDAALEPDQSGVDIAYDGVWQTTTEYVGAALGNPAVTKTKKDAFGRLIEVHEQRSAGPVEWAVTTYAYSPDDNVKTVVDPEDVTTVLVHDWAGRRTEITRAGRTWRYRYDKNGNMEYEEAPSSATCTPQPTCIVDHANTTIYDDLDRPASKTIGPRDLSPADQQLFGGRTEVFWWDIGGNMKGHLRWWFSYAPNASLYTLVRHTRVTSQGQRFQNIHGLRIESLPLIERSTYHVFHPFGGVSSSAYYDQVDTNHYTYTEHSYDARALPTQITLHDMNSGNPPQQLAIQTRNVAGLVTKRRTDTTGAMTFVESNWTYDQLGRVTSQVVQKGTSSGPEQIVRQDLAYFGNDDPKQLTHYLGTTPRQFEHTFDHRHQLTGVTETTSPGYFTASYQYGEAGRFMQATEASALAGTLPPGSDVKPRDVDYVYGGADPEQVTALVHASGPLIGTAFAGYQYDEAGNQTWRCYGSSTPPCTGESMDFVYDGKNQLRRATKKDNGQVLGSEEYWYDGEGTRMVVLKRDAAGTKTELISFVDEVEGHYDGTGALTYVYAHLSLGTPVARVKRTWGEPKQLEYQFHGLASNTIAAVAQDGTINASFSYAPFGAVIEATDAGAPSAGTEAHRRRFNDKYHDDLTDLAYYGFRYYDKTLIGWTQSDPLFRFAPDAAWTSPRHASLYTISLNNPLRFVDPDGRQGEDVLSAGPGLVALGEGMVALGEGLAVGVATIGFVAVVLAGPIAQDLSDSPIDCYAYACSSSVPAGWNEPLSLPAPTINMSSTEGAGGREEGGTEGRSASQDDAPPPAAGDVRVGPNVQVGQNVQVGGGQKPPEGGRQRGDKMKESSTGGEALDQLHGVEGAQQRARKSGSGDATIQSTKKSQQNVDNRNRRIRNAEDAKAEYGDDDID